MIIADLFPVYSTSCAVLLPIAAVPSAAQSTLMLEVPVKATVSAMIFVQEDGTTEILRAAAGQVKGGTRLHLAVAIYHDALRPSGGWCRQIDNRVAAD